MINYQFFPRSRGVTPEIKAVIDCFKVADKKKPKSHLVSNEMLELVRPDLEKIGFKVERGKGKRREN